MSSSHLSRQACSRPVAAPPWRAAVALAVTMLAAWSPIVSAADPAVVDFERFIKRARAQTDALKQVYYDDQFKTWNRTAYVVRNLRYDVVKTQSLVNPLAGKVSFWLMMSFSNYPTQEEAVAAKIEPPELSAVPNERVELAFLYSEGVWQLASGRSAVGLGGTNWTEASVGTISAAALSQPASSYRALVPWMSSRRSR